MDKALLARLKQLHAGEVSPSPEWVRANRAILLSQIKNTLPAGMPQQSKWQRKLWETFHALMPQTLMASVGRPVMVGIVAAVMVMTGYATVDAASDALPDNQLLYPVKKTVEAFERTTVALKAKVTGERHAPAEFSVKLAGKRADEVKRLVAATDDDGKKDHVAKAVSELQFELTTANDNLEDIKQSGAKVPTDVAKTITEGTGKIKDTLTEVKENLQVNPGNDTEGLSEEITVAKDLVKDAGVKVVEVVVASLSTDEATQVIATALDQAVSDVEHSKQHIEGVQTLVEAVKTEVKGLASEEKKAGIAAGGATSQELESVTAKASSVINTVVDKTNAVSVEVGKKISEAKELLTKGELTEAFAKIQELTDASKEAEKNSDVAADALKKVQTALPLVEVVKGMDQVVAVPTLTDGQAGSTTLKDAAASSNTVKKASDAAGAP